MQTLFSWFDIVTVVMVGVGIWVGRRRGMSAELLDLILWGAIVGLGGLLNNSIGLWIQDVMSFSPGTSHILAYGSVAGALFLLAFVIKRGVGEKLVSSDAFGGMEYYLGMIAGAVRFLCILLAVLAVLHAPYISQEELNRKIETQKKDLGQVYFPPFGQIQKSIFHKSLTGKAVEQYMSALLIQPVKGRSGPSDNIYQTRQRLVDEAGALK